MGGSEGGGIDRELNRGECALSHKGEISVWTLAVHTCAP